MNCDKRNPTPADPAPSSSPIHFANEHACTKVIRDSKVWGSLGDASFVRLLSRVQLQSRNRVAMADKKKSLSAGHRNCVLSLYVHSSGDPDALTHPKNVSNHLLLPITIIHQFDDASSS